MRKYFVETYPAAGNTTDPETESFETLEDALADAAVRLGLPVAMPPDWIPGQDLIGPEIPRDASPVGAWHESDKELCGGVAIWSR